MGYINIHCKLKEKKKCKLQKNVDRMFRLLKINYIFFSVGVYVCKMYTCKCIKKVWKDRHRHLRNKGTTGFISSMSKVFNIPATETDSYLCITCVNC